MTALVVVVVALVLVALGAMVVVLVGMRRRWPPVVEGLRRFSRAVVNPRMLKTAGTPGAYAAVVEHVGRRSGRAYRTPVVAAPTDDGFVIALPYDTTSNWVRNVLAAGAATIVHEGATYRVQGPRIVPLASVDHHFPARERRSHERFAVPHALRVTSARPST